MGILIDKKTFAEDHCNSSSSNNFYDEAPSEIPSAIDSQRPPQRNDDNLSCHCACLSGATNESDRDVVTNHSQQPTDEDANTDDTSDDASDHHVNGEEGAEDHLIEVGDLGLVSLGVIHRALARHRRCTCHNGILPDPDDYPFGNSQLPSGFQSPQASSMIVEGESSGEHSMMSSQVLSVCSRSSSVLFNVGTGQGYSLGPFPVVWNPLRLTEEVRFEYPAEIGLAGSQLGMSGEDWAENDCW